MVRAEKQLKSIMNNDLSALDTTAEMKDKLLISDEGVRADTHTHTHQWHTSTLTHARTHG